MYILLYGDVYLENLLFNCYDVLRILALMFLAMCGNYHDINSICVAKAVQKYFNKISLKHTYCE